LSRDGTRSTHDDNTEAHGNISDVILRLGGYAKRVSVNLSKPEPAPTNSGAPIVPMVIRDLEDRRAFGRAKYGAELCVQAGRDALVDCYQEALDLVVYLRQVIAQREARAEAIVGRSDCTPKGE
jgi:hypothetical protein